MATDLLPALLSKIVERRGDSSQYISVKQLEKEGSLFVQDGNHGNNRPRQNEFSTEGTPFVQPPNLIGGEVDFAKCGMINEKAFLRIRKGIGRKGDILITTNATIGRKSIVKQNAPEPFVVNPQITIWRSLDSEKIDQRYLYYFMSDSSFMNQLWSFCGDNSTFNYVSLSLQKKIFLSLPKICEQKAIAHILGTLDDKIELNRQMNQTLETIAQALFKSWFVDFDPVIDNALAAGNDIPDELKYRATARQALGDQRKPLPPEIQRQFPDKFVLSEEMGWIPEGWKAGSIASICTVKGGYAYKSKDFTSVGCPVIKIKNINADRSLNVDDIQHIPQSIAEQTKNFWLKTGDLLMAMTGATVGKYGLLVTKNRNTYLLNQRVAKFQPLDGVSKNIWFAYCVLKEEIAINYIVNVAHGSAQPNISADEIMAAPLIAPSLSLVQRFDEHVDPYFQKTLVNQALSYKLGSIRDTLLPKLMSGELRVPEAEKLVGEAV